ncbi:hypothetical protein M5X06_00290 [Paenibacillus alvei]|uniref:Uncharacterized protein n=1 Tax=Paenibacillus alvei TaxID=44250 RepID=A0ABT4H4J5_PAEAL|nr:hypothetical protein [Paenibacillus alvei]MCY9763539.1 hypothetical protein [Paenibacillus alvei]MCY9765274.1 hypothetical protein [Paenibacillus alvei]NEZ44423.1 hypothetical protein [Paenibacillus alvei]
MGVHFLGKIEQGVLVRFTYEYSDTQFFQLLERVGGYLPPNWKAWHLEDGETLTNSKRVQAIASRVPTHISRFGCQPSQIWIEEMLRDDVNRTNKR